MITRNCRNKISHMLFCCKWENYYSCSRPEFGMPKLRTSASNKPVRANPVNLGRNTKAINVYNSSSCNQSTMYQPNGTCEENSLSVNCAKAKGKMVTLKAMNFDECVAKGVECLKNGGIIATPTDTIYGITCLAQNSSSIEELYNIKGRDANKPIAICVSNISQIYEWADVNISKELLSDLLPGPVTLVFTRSKRLNPQLNPDTHLVGVRIPDYQFIRELCKDEPLALTSANRSNAGNSVSIQDFSDLFCKLDVIFDGGLTSSGNMLSTGSTVVDLSQPNTFHVLRNGRARKSTVKTLVEHGLVER